MSPAAHGGHNANRIDIAGIHVEVDGISICNLRIDSPSEPEQEPPSKGEEPPSHSPENDSPA